MANIKIRPARAAEASALSELCKRAKAYWGYDDAFMAKCSAALTIPTSLIEKGFVLAATDDDTLLGVAAMCLLHDNVCELTHLFVEPSAINTGVGRYLFDAITTLARKQAGRTLYILADPHAENFYLHLGGQRIGWASSDAIAGRDLPLLMFDLSRVHQQLGYLAKAFAGH